LFILIFVTAVATRQKDGKQVERTASQHDGGEGLRREAADRLEQQQNVELVVAGWCSQQHQLVADTAAHRDARARRRRRSAS